MIVQFNKYFVKRLGKRPRVEREKFYARLQLFKGDPFHPLLQNHSLTGAYQGFRSINITGDFRAVFTIQEEIVRFEDIGTHSELYE